MTTHRALLIPVEGPIQEIELPTADERGSLERLQEAVGGWIEAVSLPDFITDSERATCYVNEEGKIHRLAFNGRATDLLVGGVGLSFGDYIAGPMVVCGFVWKTGANASIPEGVEKRIRLIESEAS